MLKPLTDALYVAPQIDTATVAEAKGLGVTLIVNNRPEGESADQTPGNVIEAAALAAGIAYVAIPVTHAGFSPWQIDALDKALADNGAASPGGKTLCYCRSGTRSTLLWSLARARAGDDTGEIADIAEAAGYDVSPIRQIMDALKAGA